MKKAASAMNMARMGRTNALSRCLTPYGMKQIRCIAAADVFTKY